MFNLNEGQIKAKSDITAMIDNPAKNMRFMTLEGPAGSGKTYLLQQIVKTFNGKKIGFCAPTHKAVKVLTKMAFDAGIDHLLDIRTIHSALGLTMKRKYGKEVLERNKFAKERVYDVLWIDEGSMLGDDILGYILNCKSDKVIFVGDRYQIGAVNAPVGSVSSIFTDVDLITRLTEIVRTAEGNPIIELATSFRSAQDTIMAGGIAGFPMINNNLNAEGHGIKVTGITPWFEQYVALAKSKEFAEDPDHARIVCYTNDCVDEINAAVRTHLHGHDVVDYLVGEVLVAQAKGPTENSYKNAEELKILSIEDDMCDTHDVPCYNVSVISMHTGLIHSGKIVHNSYKETYASRLQSLASRAGVGKGSKGLWREFWSLNDAFMDVKDIYAMTSHKSQGSTFNHTYIYADDFIKFGVSLEILRLMYTAITRSRLITNFGTEHAGG